MLKYKDFEGFNAERIGRNILALHNNKQRKYILYDMVNKKLVDVPFRQREGFKLDFKRVPSVSVTIAEFNNRRVVSYCYGDYSIATCSPLALHSELDLCVLNENMHSCTMDFEKKGIFIKEMSKSDVKYLTVIVDFDEKNSACSNAHKLQLYCPFTLANVNFKQLIKTCKLDVKCDESIKDWVCRYLYYPTMEIHDPHDVISIINSDCWQLKLRCEKFADIHIVV
jgi:hypothetical protein